MMGIRKALLFGPWFLQARNSSRLALKEKPTNPNQTKPNQTKPNQTKTLALIALNSVW